jgi:hypothetical protein
MVGGGRLVVVVVVGPWTQNGRALASDAGTVPDGTH